MQKSASDFFREKQQRIYNSFNDPNGNEMFSREQAADYLNVSLSTLIRKAQAFEITPYHATNGRVLFRKSDLDNLKELKKSNEKFNLYFDTDLKKSSDTKGNETITVRGIAATNDLDDQGEILDCNGFDLTDLNTGKALINYNHQLKSNPSAAIGYISKGAIVNDGKALFVEGKLFSNSDLVKGLIQTVDNLKKNNSPVRLQWSVEGKKLALDPLNNKRVTKAKIGHVALCLGNAINQKTYAEIIKSFGSGNEPQPKTDVYSADLILNKKQAMINSLYRK